MSFKSKPLELTDPGSFRATSKMMLSSLTTLLLLLLFHHLAFPVSCNAGQNDNLREFIKSRYSYSSPLAHIPEQLDILNDFSPVNIERQDGFMSADKIDVLPGQPAGVDFAQYAGYVTVNPNAGRALFYYFVESPHDPTTKPLLLWLNGGPGCSSLGFGAMEEIGPFLVKSDGKTLIRNDYSWNSVANILFLESPAGVGFSYSNTSSDNNRSGDKIIAHDSYTFLVNWLERFPHYKNRDFYIAGESYAGHYIPQLAQRILARNKNRDQTIINLKGIAIGNGWIDDKTGNKGIFDYYWSHGLNSDETHAAIHKYCFSKRFSDDLCQFYQNLAYQEAETIYPYNIYGTACNASTANSSQTISVYGHDPCFQDHVKTYLNHPEVQTAFHAKPTNWSGCRFFQWADNITTVLPIIKEIASSGIGLWIYSGDLDTVCPMTSSRYALNRLKLPVQISWRPWFSGTEVGGYVIGYRGVKFATVREAGHAVPSDQPIRALTLISSFLKGRLPPTS